VRLTEVKGNVDVGTLSGDIELRGLTAKIVRVKTTSGEIGFEGAIDPAGRYELSTHSGEIGLRIPRDASAQLTVSTWTGSIDTPDFPITLKPGDHSIGMAKSKRYVFELASSSGRVLSDEERMEFIGRVYKLRYKLALRFLELAERNAKDPIALDALIQAVWQVNTTPWPVELVGEDPARSRAFELLLRDHIRSDKLGPLCQRVSWGFCKEYETFLRAAVAKNPHKPVQVTACLSLAQFLKNRLQRLDLCIEQPELAKEFAGLFGKEYFADLRRQDRETALREIEAMFEQAAAKYGDVKLPGSETVAVRAEAELYGIRHLSVGKTAPDIEGEDEDGKRFKLSDYRGKVVLLDFWSYV
jgi:hypothetical protein